MRVGTKSVLYGAHAFYLHPWFVAWAWWKLFGFPWDPRLWVAFFVHDLGYWGCPDMDGDQGEAHPFFGARVMSYLFDEGRYVRHTVNVKGRLVEATEGVASASPFKHSFRASAVLPNAASSVMDSEPRVSLGGFEGSCFKSEMISSSPRTESLFGVSIF